MRPYLLLRVQHASLIVVGPIAELQVDAVNLDLGVTAEACWESHKSVMSEKSSAVIASVKQTRKIPRYLIFSRVSAGRVDSDPHVQADFELLPILGVLVHDEDEASPRAVSPVSVLRYRVPFCHVQIGDHVVRAFVHPRQNRLKLQRCGKRCIDIGTQSQAYRGKNEQ